VYHLELRHFPHNTRAFNLSDEELRPVVEPWAREQVVEFGERKWSPHQARLTILEGPPLPVEELSMGRGWSVALRESEDVTERVLAAVTAGFNGPGDASSDSAGASAGTSPDASVAALATDDPLGTDLAALLGPDAAWLLVAWRAAAAGSPGLAPSESLALAEQALRSSRPGPG